SHGRQVHRCHGIQKTHGETAETSVAEARIGFLLEQLKPIESFLLYRGLNQWPKQEVAYVIRQRAADQKFHREVVNAFGVCLLIRASGQRPTLGENIANRM